MDFSKMKHEFVTNTFKRVTYAHHCEFLTQCLSHKVVPKGMQINLKINAPGKPSSSFQNWLLGIQKKASFVSMRLLLSRNQSIIKQIDTSLKKNSELNLKTKQTQTLLMVYSQRPTSTKVSSTIACALNVQRKWRTWEFTGLQNVRLFNLSMANYLEIGVLSVQLGRQMSRWQTLILLWSTFPALNSQNLRHPCFLKV